MKYLPIVTFTLLLFACYGWGYALTRWSAIRDKDDFAFLSAVGVAILILLGGVLNFARLAYPYALSILFLFGLIFFVIHCSANAKKWSAAWRASSSFSLEKLKPMSGHIMPIGILMAAVSFYALTLLPVAAFFNYGDDSTTYIPRSLRMLQVGTIAGNPFELLGIDLGAHAFLNGFVLLGFPVEYLGGFDSVFGFALAGLLLIAFGKEFNLHWSYTAFALLGFIVINPQSVNISALYIGSAIILGILFASCRLLNQMEKSDANSVPLISIVIPGLLLACLIALKTSFASYALTYFAILFTCLLLTSKNKPSILKLCGIFMLVAFLALLPWLALHADSYASAIHTALHQSPMVAKGETPLHKTNISKLFSTASLSYGGSYLSYGIIVLMLFMVGCYSLFNAFGSKFAPSQRGYFLVSAASCAAAIISYFFNGYIVPSAVAVRYSCPVLLATFPFALLAASMQVSNSYPEKLLNLPVTKTVLVLSMPLLIAILFWNNFVSRIERVYYQHMLLPFNYSDASIEHYNHAASPDARKIIREIQNKAQPAQKIFAWIAIPAHLDFSRNEIYFFSGTCLLNSWVKMPLNGNANSMIQYLKGLGIRYILWEYGNEGIVLENRYREWLLSPVDKYRTMGEKGLYSRRMLALVMNEGNFLYNANGIVLIDLQQFK